jgi:hypothetical protein
MIVIAGLIAVFPGEINAISFLDLFLNKVDIY